MEKDVKELLQELLEIYTFVNYDNIYNRIANELDDNTKKMVYELSDGERTTREIGARANISHGTVAAYWKRWALKGMVISAARSGRYKARFKLKDFGLSVVGEDEE